jgi:hypothetical protein
MSTSLHHFPGSSSAPFSAPGPPIPPTMAQPLAHAHSHAHANANSHARAIRKSSSAPVRRRISRACDQCNQLRTKCDGQNPCAHCIGTLLPVAVRSSAL